MDSLIQQLKTLIQKAERILITSHISPDPDAVSSALLLARTLKENFSDKKIQMVLEEKPLKDLSFLEGYSQIKFHPVAQAVKEFEPDLLIVVDANNYNRVSRTDADKIAALVSSGSIKTAIIDHHEFEGRENVDVFINNKRPATAEEIYALCFEQLGLNKPVNYAETTLLGIVSDTQRHRFDHPGYRETFRIMSELMDDGASVEKLESQLEHYNKDELQVIGHLAANVNNSGKGYTYSFIADDFTKKWQVANKSIADLKNGCELFTNQFMRNFEGNNWGFIVYPELVVGSGNYGVSLRALSGAKDVSAVARKLGGGGHKPAAGAKVKAESIDEALAKVKTAILSM